MKRKKFTTQVGQSILTFVLAFTMVFGNSGVNMLNAYANENTVGNIPGGGIRS